MIHYHGTPITPTPAAVQILASRHACVSFARPDQIALVAEVCQSFCLDNGAFTIWKQGGTLDVEAYAEFVREWWHHPGFDFCFIPDSIEGDENEQERLIAHWFTLGMLDFHRCAPVWHMHERLARLQTLMAAYPRIALGSSGEYAEIGTERWWKRMDEAMAVVCDENGRPKVKLHGLRMLSPTVFSHLPLASADSTNVAQNIGIDQRWTGSYQPVTKTTRGLILAERIESHVSAARYTGSAFGLQHNLELIG